MIHIVYEVVTCLLLLTVVKSTSVQPKEIIYIDEVNRTLDSYCWKDRDEFQSSCVEVALNGVQLPFLTVKP